MSGSSFPKKNFLVYLPNNFHVWRELLVEYAAQDFGALATALHDERLINFDYVVSDIPFDETLFVAEGKTGGEDAPSGTTSMDGEVLLPSSMRLLTVTSKIVMSSRSKDPVVAQAKIMVMKAKERLYEKRTAFFAFIMGTLSAQSKAVIQAHPKFQESQIASNVFTLFQIVKATHLVNLEVEQLRLEQKLQGMVMGGEDFSTYSAKFHDILVALASSGSDIKETRVVCLFLMSLRGSPLQHAADRWLDNPSQEDFPASFEAARNLMHMAWLSQTSRLQQSQDVAMVAYTTTTRPGLQQSRQAAVKCLFCDKNHATEDCRLFRLERRDGQTVLVSSEVKKKKPSRQRKARGQSSGLVIRGSVSNSSFSVGSSPLGSTGPALVLDISSRTNPYSSPLLPVMKWCMVLEATSTKLS
jgi:hypothetical protein